MQSCYQLCHYVVTLTVLDISPLCYTLVLGAGCAAALRWIFTQKLKSVDEVYNDPIYCVFGIGLPSAVLVSPFAVYDIIRFVELYFKVSLLVEIMIVIVWFTRNESTLCYTC